MKQLFQKEMSRRSFFKYSLACGCGFIVTQMASASSPEGAKNVADNPLADQAMLLKDFRETNDGALQYMTQAYGADIARSITRDAARQFQALLPLLPDLGGARNIVIHDFPVAVCCVAYSRPMKAHGKTAEELGKMIYDLFDIELRRMPEAAALSEGAKQFTPAHIDKLKEWSRWTQKREFPANWVVAFVPGNGTDFDYGYDYSECAIVKYLKAHEAADVAPYVCLNDFIRSRTYGTGLRRTKTLAQGDSVCNFRYKKGRAVIQDWSTEIPLIRKRIEGSANDFAVETGLSR